MTNRPTFAELAARTQLANDGAGLRQLMGSMDTEPTDEMLDSLIGEPAPLEDSALVVLAVANL